jgi:myosin heavy subunit
MIDTLAIYEKLKEFMDPRAAEGVAEVLGTTVQQVQDSMTERWFRTLDAEIRELREEIEERFARMQQTVEDILRVQRQHTEEIAELRKMTQKNTQAIAELVQVTQQHSKEIAELREMTQKNTQAIAELVQVTQQHSKEIAELREMTQKNTQAIAELVQVTQQHSKEIAELRQTVAELVQMTRQNTEAIAELRQTTQQHSEEISDLRRTVQELVEVQKQTQEDIRRLTWGLDDLRKQVGGLSMTVGYTLENAAYRALPHLLNRDYGLQIDGDLTRRFVEDNQGEHIEVNIFGQARRNGEVLTIVGESKAQLSKNDVDSFLRRKIQRLQGRYPNLFPVLVVHMTSEWDVEAYAREQGVAVYYSYQF